MLCRTMQLLMYIGNDLIEAVPLNDENITRPGYLGQFKRRLKSKYNELILQYSTPPEFLVSNPLPQTSKPPVTVNR
jgi:hypothetical protein